MPNFDVAIDYLRKAYERDDRLAVVRIQRDTGAVKHEFRAAYEIGEPSYQAHLRAANANGADIYMTVNTLRPEATGRTKGDIDTVRHVYLDVDAGGKEAVDQILKTEGMPAAHSVFETSPGKHQILWQVEGFEKDQAEQMVRQLAAKHNADQAVWDCARVLRLPGFRNWKYEQRHYVKDVCGAPSERIYRPEDFPAYPIERDVLRFGTPRSPHRSVPGNSQSEKDFAFALRHLEKGDLPPEVIEQRIADYRRARRDKPHADSYAHRTVLNARARLMSQPGSSNPASDRESSERSR
jgi:hypothetical protein